ncbi:alpha/beta hydrolase fold domain-containing protein [Flavobacterium sp. 3HN19-14]|uniref:alpha/beta hydrolase fold domain-containing protein n=1 Tax=Flavobacterium sp. 3HN19-14 TaxID=3448133 RepID=UPI003EE32CB5
MVYYHGGGFVIADINVYNGGAQGLCEQTNAIVVSVEYPKGLRKSSLLRTWLLLMLTNGC